MQKSWQGIAHVLGSSLAQVIAGNIPATAATEGFCVVAMSRMRVIDIMGVPGAFAVRYLATHKILDTSRAEVPEKKEKKSSASGGLHGRVKKGIQRPGLQHLRVGRTFQLRLAGFGMRLRVRTRVSHVACATTASRMLPVFGISATIATIKLDVPHRCHEHRQWWQ